MTSDYSLSDISAVTNGNRNEGLFGDGNGWWIILLFVLFACGWGGFGGAGGYGGGGAQQNYVLASDFATIQRQLSDGFNSIDNALDRQNAGICDLGYTQLSLNNGTNMAMAQGFNAVQTQLADCCCKTQSGIERINTGVAMAAGDINAAIKDCCCEQEKIAMQSRFDAAQNNCATLTAIDKLGDRIIDYMAADKAQTLRDENQSLRLAASQAAQNQYLINQLRPMPIPAYASCNPWAASYGFGNNCGCGSF